MKITRLNISNFRHINNQDIEFRDKIMTYLD